MHMCAWGLPAVAAHSPPGRARPSASCTRGGGAGAPPARGGAGRRAGRAPTPPPPPADHVSAGVQGTITHAPHVTGTGDDARLLNGNTEAQGQWPGRHTTVQLLGPGKECGFLRYLYSAFERFTPFCLHSVWLLYTFQKQGDRDSKSMKAPRPLGS